MKEALKNFLRYVPLFLYPIFISVLLEYNISQNLSKTLNFLISKPNILLFNILLSSIFFVIIFFIFKKPYISILVHGIIFYILSCIEYFKYKTSGSHFVISDLLMTKNISDVGKFASLEITYPLVINLLLIFLYVYLIYKSNIQFNLSIKTRIFTCSSLTLITTIILTTSIFTTIFSAFKIESVVATNILESNEYFNDVGFLPYLTQTTSQNIMDTVQEPENYSDESIYKLFNNIDNTKFNSIQNKENSQPNVIFIMSESFSDFRVFDSANVKDDIYKGFDEVSNEGFIGECVVPTFGGYTTRTEFELLFGLPTYAINTPSVPQNLVKDQDFIDTFPNYFKSLGYNTAYIHPFSKSFYNRETLYPKYGFDKLYFDENMTVETENFRRYISDKSVFNQIKDILIQNNSPSYIYATTMQNHQPYYENEAEVSDQLSYYLEGIKETSNQLRSFTNWLKEFNEDVILVFVGDHFPFFTPDDNVYNRLGVTDSNSQSIYTQKYILWNNYDNSIFDKDINTISTFYIPYLVAELIDAINTPYIDLMKKLMYDYPLYSPSIQSSSKRNETLDLITYDKVLGNNFSQHYSLTSHLTEPSNN